MPEGYSLTDTSVNGTVTTLTNTHKDEVVKVSGKKTWNDVESQLKDRPSSITVHLFADGAEVDSTTATANDNWTYSFGELPKFKAGKEIAYTVTEDTVTGYVSQVNGYDLVNTHIAKEEVEFYAMKILQGRTLSADEFTFELLENGTVIQTATNAGDGRAYFKPIEYTTDTLGTHNYSIREVQGDAKGVTYDTTEHPFTVTVTDNGNGTLNVAYNGYDPTEGVAFTNTYGPTGSVTLEASKMLEGADLTANAYTFQLADPQGNVYATARNAVDGKVTFPKLTFKAAGTYRYIISEVIPEDAQTLGPDKVSNGVAYDQNKVKVSVEAIDNFDGTLRFVTTYDNGEAGFVNKRVADANFPLAATKAIEGRTFQAGDEFTFAVSGDEGAPMPENAQVTIQPTEGSQAAVNFGNIAFTTDDLGKTYTYTITEQRAGETVNGLQYDPFAHWVKLTVVDAGDGGLAVEAAYQDDADGITFTNRYGGTGQVSLEATKVLQGRALADGEFFFELAGDGLEGTLHASAAADGSVHFAPISYTQADAGKDFHYTIKEVQGTLGGITYDQASYDVTVHVTDNGDGTLTATPDYDTVPVFTNTYTAANTQAAIKAHKSLTGAKLAEGQFSFQLTGTSDNAAATAQTVKNAADGTVTFDAIEYTEPGTYTYRVNEVIPAGATDNGDGTFTGTDNIVYDGTAHEVVVTVTDDGAGKLKAEVAYDDASGIDFGNTALVRTGFEFQKYYYGGVGTFDFTLTAVDAQGNARAGQSTDYSDAKSIVDDGTKAFTATVQNGKFTDGKASVVFPEIAYTADGDYYYLVVEDAMTDSSVIGDAAQYLVHVVVANGQAQTPTYELIYDGQNLGATTDLAFYNNAAITLSGGAVKAQGYTNNGERTRVYPKAKKYVNDKTNQLVGGEYTFELYADGADKPLAVATNDETGNIAFFDESKDPGLVFDEPGTYRYTMREVAGDEAGMIYDNSVISLTVEVTKTKDGLQATETYNGPGGSEPAFYNVKEGMDITVQKVSRSGGEGLPDCVYGLYMVGEGGDALIKEATSDANGFITFKDVKLMQGQKYYFKEVAAPKGHTLDPYRTAYFSLNAAGDKLELVEATADDGWHSATENIEADRARGKE